MTVFVITHYNYNIMVKFIFELMYFNKLMFKEGVTGSLESGDPLHMSCRLNQPCEMRLTVLFSKKIGEVWFLTVFSKATDIRDQVTSFLKKIVPI